MRKTMLVITTMLAAGAASMTGSAPAVAYYDPPYCLQGRGVGVPGDCSYFSYASCMAAASGRALYCNVNPRVAFGQQQQQPRRRAPRYYYYD